MSAGQLRLPPHPHAPEAVKKIALIVVAGGLGSRRAFLDQELAATRLGRSLALPNFFTAPPSGARGDNTQKLCPPTTARTKNNSLEGPLPEGNLCPQPPPAISAAPCT